MSRRHKPQNSPTNKNPLNYTTARNSEKDFTTYEGLHGLVSDLIKDCISKSLSKIEGNLDTILAASINEPFTKETEVFDIDGNVKKTTNKIIDLFASFGHPAKPKKSGRGRPMINRLCSLFDDNGVWSMAKKIYRIVYKDAIEKAKDLVQYLVCFICSIFKMHADESEYGRVAYFHKLISKHLGEAIMPTLRSLQGKLKWFREWTRSVIITAKEKADEKKHQAWEDLTELIYTNMLQMAPQYAI